MPEIIFTTIHALILCTVVYFIVREDFVKFIMSLIVYCVLPITFILMPSNRGEIMLYYLCLLIGIIIGYWLCAVMFISKEDCDV